LQYCGHSIYKIVGLLFVILRVRVTFREKEESRPMSQFHRWQTPIIEQALQTRRIIILAGPRQCGKTTLSKALELADYEYRTLDDKMLQEAAIADPHEFVKRHKALMIIDEVQKAVELLPAIKKVVDDDNRPGQYLLTGSANIQSLPGVTESLAGRAGKIRLRPLAQGEILGNKPVFLQHAFEQTLGQLSLQPLERDEILQIAMYGGYPEALTLSPSESLLWHEDYVDALLERDLMDIVNIRRKDSMKNLVHIVCTWSTKPIDMSAIGSGLAIKRPTLESYVNALEALYLVERIPAWTKTDYGRINRQSKLIINDSGLMSSLLRWQLDDIRFDDDKTGKLIETHVGNELQKHIDTARDQYELFHYRDREKREIDFIVRRNNGDLLGIEVKSSTSVGNEDFKHLRWFQENLTLNGKNFTGIIIYTGEHLASFNNNLWAVPITALYGG